MARQKRHPDPLTWKLVYENKCRSGKVQVFRCPQKKTSFDFFARVVSVNGNITHTGKGYNTWQAALKGLKATKTILSQIKL